MGSKNRIVWMACQQEFLKCNLPRIPWGMQFWFVTVIPKYLKCGDFKVMNECLHIVFLSIMVMNLPAMLCSLHLLVDLLLILPLYHKLWLRINFCMRVRNYHVSCTADNNDTEFLFSWIPQHIYTLHLTEDWGRASLCNARHLSH
jgi:hypothetical protein